MNDIQVESISKKPATMKELQTKQEKRQVRQDSLNYLVLWKSSRAAWKFQKSRQIWLLKNTYNIERLPIKHFKILKKYIKTMQDGQVKERILKEALELIEDNKKATFDEIENKLVEDTPEGEEKIKIKERLLQAKLSRAAKIAKALSKD